MEEMVGGNAWQEHADGWVSPDGRAHVCGVVGGVGCGVGKNLPALQR
jgi:hypothetical protein